MEPVVWVMTPLSENERPPPTWQEKGASLLCCVPGRVSPPLGSRQTEVQGAGVVLEDPGMRPHTVRRFKMFTSPSLGE